jgi:CRP-like cAMP-binding protein
VMREVTYGAGFRVVTIEDYGTAVYAIEEGQVEVLPREGGSEMLGPGDVFGEIGLLLTGKRTATVVARTPVQLLALSSQSFESIRSRVPQLERLLRRIGGERAER